MRGEVISVLSLEGRYHILSLARCASYMSNTVESTLFVRMEWIRNLIRISDSTAFVSMSGFPISVKRGFLEANTRERTEAILGFFVAVSSTCRLFDLPTNQFCRCIHRHKLLARYAPGDQARC